MKTNNLDTQLIKVQIPGLGPIAKENYERCLRGFDEGKKLTIINIICPGYVKKREAGMESFDFPELSENISECPNVKLMIEKMNNVMNLTIFTKGKNSVDTIMILADQAILNYQELVKKQNVKKVMDKFYESILRSKLFDTERVKFV